MIRPSLFFAAAVLYGAEPGMVFIPGGEFPRGRTHALPDDGLKWDPVLLQDERPVKRIKLDPFYLDAHEVTNREYAAFVKAAKHRAPYNWAKGELPTGKENFPVAAVDWFDASAYCQWSGKRLPTEAEWERAARGVAEGGKYNWGEREPTKKDACFDTLAGPCEVAKLPANYFGLFDMAGNVWEWTADWYKDSYYKESADEDPQGPPGGKYRVLRGGSWDLRPRYARVSFRDWDRPAGPDGYVGFRCSGEKLVP